ncbi:MAG: hemolytic protein HlpA-like protein [Parcubacteria group bacterium]|nr:hemolytic protein HlpA-like protein [Parcubacteria group bacterium]
MKELSTPVLLIAFNRPETTQKIFNEIRKAGPKKLFLAVDGPRSTQPGEAEKVRTVRDIEKQVDWECEVHTLFREENLGCRLGVSGAITWFFENVDEGIILEDDCLPDPTFFRYCEELLGKHRDDERIMHIGGNNFQGGSHMGASYYFSIYPHIWGWATWKRAWKHYDVRMASYPAFKESGQLEEILPNREARTYWLEIFDRYYEGRGKDTWDYQWVYAIWSHRGFSITPKENLVINIGVGRDATHTRDPDAFLSRLTLGAVPSPLVQPTTTALDEAADARTFSRFFQRNIGRKQKIKNFIQRFI